MYYYGTTKIPVISVVGRSNTGKTTYLEKLIPAIKKRGIRLAVIKHDAHKFDIDIPGKDSWKLTQAGADVMIISAAEKLAFVEQRKKELSLDEIVSRIDSVDLIITEGYKFEDKPKIEIHRKVLNQELLCKENQLLAIVSDELIDISVPCLEFDDLDKMVDIIWDYKEKYQQITL